MVAGAFIIYMEEIEREDPHAHYLLLSGPIEDAIKVCQLRHDKFMDNLIKEVEAL